MIELKPQQTKTYNGICGDFKIEIKSYCTATSFIQLYVNENYIERITVPPQRSSFKEIYANGDVLIINMGPSTVNVLQLES
ncbi:hypothetical protein DICPUDRAFT_148701 [Dictyostelium purpureum]|uniref:Galectin n=1 Tax=Dictyostelium purpureum TaxID=5786 RepID=F0ZBS4_DICPU|nr:uncharacterized protein DICPUDRAFT_148701 [Dictyostelium purpureum]EGC38586.1 hypothetical protein DICPUDRAFT_148701 [Dictyostelium purpureum]|eukprot:XP_003284865.1 hypothetical protein DICPUDRAFT_148701 [Dictyostelium purpureum]